MLNSFDQGTVVTASGNSTGVVDLEKTPNQNGYKNSPGHLAVLLSATAVSGTTPSLTVEVQWSNDGTNFFSASAADTFTALTAVGGVASVFTVKGRYARLKYTVTGTTPSFTLTNTGFATT